MAGRNRGLLFSLCLGIGLASIVTATQAKLQAAEPPSRSSVSNPGDPSKVRVNFNVNPEAKLNVAPANIVNDTKKDQETAAKIKLVKVDSRAGQSLARMPSKRQVDSPTSDGLAPTSTSRRNEDPWFLDQAPLPLQPYKFAYDVKGQNGLSEQYRQEVGDGQYLTGSYGYVLPDGIYRHVDYVADERGFRAFIRTSEPGTANQNPASVVINSNPVVVDPNIRYTAPEYNSVPLNSLDYSSLRSEIELARRQSTLGLNTPSVRNFTNPFVPQPTPISSLPEVPRGPTPTQRYNFDALQRDKVNERPQTSIGDVEGSSFPIKSWNQRNSGSGNLPSWQRSQQVEPWQRFNGGLPNNRYGSSSSARQQQEQQQPQPQQQQRPQPQRSYSYDLQPTQGSFQASTTSYLRPRVYTARPPSRTSAYRLLYDRPVTIQGDLGERTRIGYDNKHLFHPETPLLSLERSRNIAQLNQLNSAARGLNFIRPPLPADGSTLGTFSGDSQSFTGRGLRNEEQRMGQNQGDDNGLTTMSRFNSSTITLTTEFEVNQLQPNVNQTSTQLQPPEPTFAVREDFQRKGDTKGSGARLRAPYTQYAGQRDSSADLGREVSHDNRRAYGGFQADNHLFSSAGGLKDSRDDPRIELTTTASPSTERSIEPSTSAGQQPGDSTASIDSVSQVFSTKSPQPNEIEMKQEDDVARRRSDARAARSNSIPEDSLGAREVSYRFKSLDTRTLNPARSIRMSDDLNTNGAIDAADHLRRRHLSWQPTPTRTDKAMREVSEDMANELFEAKRLNIGGKREFSNLKSEALVDFRQPPKRVNGELNSHVTYDEDSDPSSEAGRSRASLRSLDEYRNRDYDNDKILRQRNTRETFAYDSHGELSASQAPKIRRRAIVTRKSQSDQELGSEAKMESSEKRQPSPSAHSMFKLPFNYLVTNRNGGSPTNSMSAADDSPQRTSSEIPKSLGSHQSLTQLIGSSGSLASQDGFDAREQSTQAVKQGFFEVVTRS